MVAITGCGKEVAWKKMFSLSEFKYSDKYVIGEIKNTTDTDYIIKIFFEYKNGSIKEKGTTELLVRSNDKEKIKVYESSIDDKYDIKVTNIEYEETLSIDKSSEKILTSNELRKAFFTINHYHDIVLSMVSVENKYEDESIYYVPISGTDKNGHIYIQESIKNGKILIRESYKADSQKPELIIFRISDKSYFEDANDVISYILDAMGLEVYDEILTLSERSNINDIINNGGSKFLKNFYVVQKIASDNGNLVYDVAVSFI